MKDYFAKMESIVIQYVAVGYLVSKEDLVLSILVRLESKYDPIICSITTRGPTNQFSLKEIQVLVLNQECKCK